tara:strand:- start:22315 stop:22467 length:153 start_codon:yes stop_codon:yes gene_type:complete
MLRGFGQRQLAIVRIKGLFDDGKILHHNLTLLQQKDSDVSFFIFGGIIKA